MKNIKNILFIGLFVTLAGQLLGQDSAINADKLYDEGKYSEAIDAYMDYLVLHTEDVLATIQLANCYLKTNELYKANALYNELTVIDNCDPELYIKHGIVLKKLMRFHDAKTVFGKYAAHNKAQAQYLMAGCDFAENLLENDARCSLENLAFNSKSSDFNPQFHNDKLIYASRRAILHMDWMPKGEVNSDKPKGASLYMVDNDEIEPFNIKDQLGWNQNIDQAVITNQDKAIAYTKFKGHIDVRVVSSATKEMQIYTTEFNETNQKWEEKSFPYNSDSYSIGFPHLNPEGTRMYFASNMPGGFGSFDIYLSTLVNNEWQKPINLGSEVNTKGNEITPHVQNSELYFASDWHQGMGGFDVFRIKKTENQWSKIENLGSCVNSSSDDFGFVVSPTSENKAFFTSNRMGGKGAEDIYGIEDIDDLETQIVQTQVQEPQLPISIKNSKDLSSSITKDIQIKGVEINLDIDNEDDFLIYDDAALKGMDLEAKQKVYFVQIAALSKMKGNLKRFNHFKKYGNVYKVTSGNIIKIRIGFFSTTQEAIKVVKELKRKGIREAFIVGDYLDQARLELITMATNSKQAEMDEDIYYNPNFNSKYKIRVVSYQYPSKFNTSNIADLGRIEHWTKKEWRIILLSGYRNVQDAKIVLDQLKSRGFNDAYIVKDENGTLVTVD